MQGTIGLLLYVAVMVLASILKKMAEDKAKKTQKPVTQRGESYTVTLEDMSAEDSVQAWSAEEAPELVNTFDRSEWASNEGTGEFGSQDRDASAVWDEDWSGGESKHDGKISDVAAFVPRKLDLKQAIVFSEIIREPRAKRPWPGR